MRTLKAQSAVELGIILALVAVIVCATLTPLGGKVHTMFQNLSPSETISASYNELLGLVSQENYKDISSSLITLGKSTNSSIQNLAAEINSILAVIAKINSNQTDSIKDEDLTTTLKYLKNTETSGSLASIIASMTEGLTLTPAEQSAITKLESYLNLKISLNTSSELNETVNSTASSVKTEIQDGALPKEVLVYENSPIQSSDLTSADINQIFSENYVTTGDASADTVNIINTYLLTQNAAQKYSVSGELNTEIASLTASIKKALIISK